MKHFAHNAYKANQTLYFTHQANRNYDSILVPAGGQPQLNVFTGYKKLKEFHPNITNWLAQFRESLPAQGYWRAAYDILMGDVGAIKVVLNADLFVSRGVITSGFHGETRIIRHLFLKYLRKTDQDDLLSPNFSHEHVTQLEKKFKEFFAKQLFFGSSQGACDYCAGYMDTLGIFYTTSRI